jgi:hypothetical protein
MHMQDQHPLSILQDPSIILTAGRTSYIPPTISKNSDVDTTLKK